MKNQFPPLRYLAIAVTSGLFSLTGTLHGQQQSDGASTSGTNALVSELKAPKSIFIIPTATREGRDPFFPRSKRGQKLVDLTEHQCPDTSALLLNGITGPPKRTAMINGRTFEKGEIGEIRLGGGLKVLITCVEIKDNAAVILVGDQRQELRLRQSL